jgi:quinol monooxygenase YgiN
MSVVWILNFEAKDGEEKSLLEFVKDIRTAVLNTDGGLSVRVLKDKDNPRQITSVEEWESIEKHEIFLKRINEVEILKDALSIMQSKPIGKYFEEA